VVIAVLVRLTFRGPAFDWSDRVGVGNKIFKMPEFRTMRVEGVSIYHIVWTSCESEMALSRVTRGTGSLSSSDR
jgi:lipopolysaccharide/colanic/teichoic acid biosynthesis glycosyltransferase